jgi:hypothetical protein
MKVFCEQFFNGTLALTLFTTNINILLEAESTAADRLYVLVVRVSGCRPKDPGFDSQHYHMFLVAVGLEQGPLSLVNINEELLERESRTLRLTAEGAPLR